MFQGKRWCERSRGISYYIVFGSIPLLDRAFNSPSCWNESETLDPILKITTGHAPTTRLVGLLFLLQAAFRHVYFLINHSNMNLSALLQKESMNYLTQCTMNHKQKASYLRSYSFIVCIGQLNTNQQDKT